MFRDEREVHLTPKAFNLLTMLIDSRPKAVPKAEILRHVWPAVFVSDASLARVITEIRTAVGDDARHPGLIRTVHTFGYAFTGPISEPQRSELRHSAGPVCRETHRCWIIYGTRDFCLAEGENTIGRDVDVNVRLESPRVSRRHARIVISSNGALLEDLESMNGTYLHGERLVAPAQLTHGDEFTVGPFRMTFRVSRGSDPTEAES